MAQYVHSHKLRLADGRSATSTEQGATNIPLHPGPHFSQSQYAELLAGTGGEAGIAAVPKQMKTKQSRPQRTGKWPFGF